MSDADTPPEPIHALIADTQLLGIECTELSAARRQSDEGDGGATTTANPAYSMRFEGRDDDRAFRVALRTEIDSGRGPIVADVTAEYELTALAFSEIDTATRVEFINNVALMTILPFTRQAIADISQRVFGSVLLMPIIQRGQMQFGASE